jgi:hypothetical protein
MNELIPFKTHYYVHFGAPQFDSAVLHHSSATRLIHRSQLHATYSLYIIL